MLDAIKRLMARETGPAGSDTKSASEEHGVRVAACALLLELAHSDGEFTEEERGNIEEALTRHFDLTIDEARTLMVEAANERGKAIDLHEFTSVITSHYDEGQRMTLAEVLWRVVYADGELSRHEDYLMRKLASLLDLRPGYLNAARSKAAPDQKG